MAEQVILPRQGQSVESCLILSWKKKEGDAVREREILVEVETDKAAFEVESTATGTLLKILHQEGEVVPVLAALAVVGEPGEDISALIGAARPERSPAKETPRVAPSVVSAAAQPAGGADSQPAPAQPAALAEAVSAPVLKPAISPRARRLAEASGLDPAAVLAALPLKAGSGPRGRILEGDVQQVLKQGRVAVGARAGSRTAGADAAAGAPAAVAAGPTPADFPGPTAEVPLGGIRKLIAERLLASLQNSAQYTLHASASAETLLGLRRKLKESREELGLKGITINDLLNFALSRVLTRYPGLNSHFLADRTLQFRRVHLAVAVDTPRGLMVPVIRNADSLTLKQITAEAARLHRACLEATVTPGELSGGTFTISNMGTLGIEGFTPVLNPPQVAILGVGSVQLRPVPGAGAVEFKPFLSLSLTANHQVVDGAPAARFLQELCATLASFETLLIA